MSDAPWTIGRLLTWTTDYLKQHGADSPRLDAEVLLAHARGCPRIQLYANFEEVASDDLRNHFRELVKKRADGMPVAYLVGKREFFSLDFKVTPDVLIPRPETEHLVMAVLDCIKLRGSDMVTVCDMCTGSGCIAIAVAKHATAARVTAVDISPNALAIAKENAAVHGVNHRIEFIESELFTMIPPDVQFDFIAANPPYISSEDCDVLPRTIRDYEPRLALEAGKHGMDVAKRLIPQAAERLRPGGWLIVEISPMIRQEVHDLMANCGPFEPPEVIKDLAGQSRVVAARKRT
jgi:release factor glutamine methyltransferase